MPFIKEDDLVNLYSEVDQLTKAKKDLQEGYIALKLKSKENHKKQSKYKIAAIILLLLCLGVILFWFFNYKKSSAVIQEGEARELILKDSIQKLSSKVQESNMNINSNQLIYLVQIGNYKKIDLFNGSKSVSNFQQIKQKNYNTYLMGGFSTYEEAKKFKNHIRVFGIRDAFIVAYKDKERIDVREALKLSNETKYLQ